MFWLIGRFWEFLFGEHDPVIKIMKKGFRKGKCDHVIAVDCKRAGYEAVTALHVMYYRKQWKRGDL